MSWPPKLKIAYVGYEHVDHGTVSDAIAGQTLFIHGKNVDEGSNKSVEDVAEAKAVAVADPKVDAETEAGTLVAATATRELQADPYRRRLDADTGRAPDGVARKLKKWSAKAAKESSAAASATRELQEDPYRRQLKDAEKESARVARKLQKWKTSGADEEQAE